MVINKKLFQSAPVLTGFAHQLRLLILAGVNVLKNDWQVITLLMLLIITYLSLRPPEEHDISVFAGIDKLKHLFAYACLVVPIFIARPQYWRFYVFAIFAFSGLIELVQPYFQRTTDISDLFANGIGLLTGCCMAHGIVSSLLLVHRLQ